MNSRAIRIRKEARALFWPWCIVVLAGATHPLFQRTYSDQPGISTLLNLLSSNLGFLVGIPLLATLSLSNEFEYKTLSALLSQPVSRMQIWWEKTGVAALAVLSASVVHAVTWWTTLHRNSNLALFASGWIVLVVASATFWTLLARSTAGSLILNISVQLLVLLGVGNLTHRFAPALMPIASAAILCYAGFMFWIGRRKLASFESADGMEEFALPEVLSVLFRPRVTGPLRNLIQKEVRLLQPVWLLMLCAIAGLLCVAPLQHFLDAGGQRVMRMLAGSMILTLSMVAVVLAGSLSMGEERMSGTHSWHLTMPVSVRQQWLLKLVVVIFTSIAVPTLVITVGHLVLLPSITDFFSPMFALDPPLLLGFALIGLCAFWCACAVKGIVKAALWVFPVAGALSFMMGLGVGLTDIVPQLRPVLRNLTGLWVSRFHPYPFTDGVILAFRIEFGVLWLLIVLGLIAVAQSYRMFRVEVGVGDGISSLIRRLLPLAALACGLGLSYRMLNDTVVTPYGQVQTVLRETHLAVESLKPDTTIPREITIDDLARVSQLSVLTRRWLNNSSVVVSPRSQEIVWVAGIKPDSKYKVTIKLPHSWSCANMAREHGVAAAPARRRHLVL